MSGVEVGYFGDCFQRPFDQVLSWLQDDAEPNADMWATPKLAECEIGPGVCPQMHAGGSGIAA